MEVMLRSPLHGIYCIGLIVGTTKAWPLACLMYVQHCHDVSLYCIE